MIHWFIDLEFYLDEYEVQIATWNQQMKPKQKVHLKFKEIR